VPVTGYASLPAWLSQPATTVACLLCLAVSNNDIYDLSPPALWTDPACFFCVGS